MNTLPSSAYSSAPVALPGDGGQQLVARGDRRRAGVHQHEAAGAVGVLGQARRRGTPGRTAPPAGRRRCRRSAPRRRRACVSPYTPDDGTTSGSTARGTSSSCEQLVVPVAACGCRTAACGRRCGVGHVHAAAGQVPDQPGVDRAERELAARRARAGARHVVEQPLELGAGEIGVEHQPGLRRDRRRLARGAQRVAHRRRAAVLPDDGVGDRPPGRALPQQRRLALVGDADGGDVARRDAGLGERLVHRRPTASPRSPRRRARPSPAAGRSGGTPAAPTPRTLPAAIEHDRARAGGALVEREDVRHLRCSVGCGRRLPPLRIDVCGRILARCRVSGPRRAVALAPACARERRPMPLPAPAVPRSACTRAASATKAIVATTASSTSRPTSPTSRTTISRCSPACARRASPVHDMWVRVTIDRDVHHPSPSRRAPTRMPYPGGATASRRITAKLVGAEPGQRIPQAAARHDGRRARLHAPDRAARLPADGRRADVRRAARARTKATAKPFQLDRCHALETTTDTVRAYYPTWYRGAA